MLGVSTVRFVEGTVNFALSTSRFFVITLDFFDTVSFSGISVEYAVRIVTLFSVLLFFFVVCTVRLGINNQAPTVRTALAVVGTARFAIRIVGVFVAAMILYALPPVLYALKLAFYTQLHSWYCTLYCWN